MAESRPAFYAAAPGGWRDWWTLLHPPYTAWHLAYVVIGASLAPHTDAVRLMATVLAFFCAVGVAAHALDEVHGHPLRTAIPDAALWLAAGAGLLGAVLVVLMAQQGHPDQLEVAVSTLMNYLHCYILALAAERVSRDTEIWLEPPTLANLFDEAREVQARRRAAEDS